MGLGLLSSPWTVTLGGVQLSVVASPDATEPQDPGYQGTFRTQDSAKTLTRADVNVPLNEFRGAGVIRRRGPKDDGKLAWTENMLSWGDNGLTLTGQRVGKGAGLGVSAGGAVLNTQFIIDSRPFAGDRYAITNGGYIFKFAGDNPAGTFSFSPAIGTFGASPLQLDASYIPTAIEVFKTAGGVPALYVATYNANTPCSRMYWYTTAGGWIRGADFTTFRIDKLVAPVWWESKADGNGANRMLAAVTSLVGGVPATTGFISNIVRHVIEGNNPALEASWIAPITLDPQYPVSTLLAFPEFAYAITPSGIWTFNEIRSMNVTPWAKVGASYTDGRFATLWRHGVAWARGFGVSYYDASAGGYARQDEPIEIGPAAQFQDGVVVAGQNTGLVPFEKWLIQAIYNNANQTTYVGRMTEDGTHYWAEHVLPPGSSIGQQITHMVISSPTPAVSTLLQSRVVNLWMFTADEPFTGTPNFNLTYTALPTGSGPLSQQVSNGTFAYLTQGVGVGRAYLTAQNWDDDLAVKFLSRLDIVRSLGGKPMAVYTRSDLTPVTTPATTPFNLTTQATWSLAMSTTSDTEIITPSAAVSGKSIGLQITLQTDSTTVGPLLQSVGMRAKVVRETFKVLTLWVILARDHPLSTGARDIRDPDDVFDSIVAFQDQGPQTYKTEEDSDADTAHTVLVEQGEGFIRKQVGAYEWQTLMQIHLTQIA